MFIFLSFPEIYYRVKSVQMRSFFLSVFSRIRTEYRKIQTRKNSVFGHFPRNVYLFIYWIVITSTLAAQEKFRHLTGSTILIRQLHKVYLQTSNIAKKVFRRWFLPCKYWIKSGQQLVIMFKCIFLCTRTCAYTHACKDHCVQ